MKLTICIMYFIKKARTRLPLAQFLPKLRKHNKDTSLEQVLYGCTLKERTARKFETQTFTVFQTLCEKQTTFYTYTRVEIEQKFFSFRKA